MEGDAARSTLHSEGQVTPLGPVLYEEAERLHATRPTPATVAQHVGVQQARLAHGKVVTDGKVALQPRRRVLQLQDRHARAVDRLDQRELARRLERLEGLREVTDKRLLLGMRWRALVRSRWATPAVEQREVEVCAVRVQLACGRAEELDGRAGHGPLSELLQPRLHHRPVVAISRLEVPDAAGGGVRELLQRPLR